MSAKRKSGKRVFAANLEYVKAQQRIRVAHKRVEDFTRHLFNALKDKEKVLLAYRKAAHRLTKLTGG